MISAKLIKIMLHIQKKIIIIVNGAGVIKINQGILLKECELSIKLELFCLLSLSTIFQLPVYIMAVSFIGGVQEKITDLSQVTDKLYHILLYDFR